MKLFMIFIVGVGLLSIPAFAVNPDYDPHWAVGDGWTVRVTFLVTSHFQHGDGTRDMVPIIVDYTYAVSRLFESNGVHLAIVDVDAHTNAANYDISDIRDWRLYFDVGRMTLVGVDDYQSKREPEAVCWIEPGREKPLITGSFPPARAIIDFPMLPSYSTNEYRVFSDPDAFGHPVVQDARFSSEGLWIGLGRSNYSYRLTFEWEKGRKWWNRAAVFEGTNVVMTGLLLDDGSR